MDRHPRGRERQKGLTLLELLVALSIMALSIGVLYRVLGMSVRNAGMLQDQQKAVLLAQTLLAAKDAIPEQGWNESGESAGYGWQVRSQPYDAAPAQAQPGATRLFAVEIEVHWGDGERLRSIGLHTLRPQRRPVVPTGAAP